jgi:hypothetical protein
MHAPSTLIIASLALCLLVGCQCGGCEGEDSNIDPTEEGAADDRLILGSAMAAASERVEAACVASAMSDLSDVRRNFDRALVRSEPGALLTALGTLPPGPRDAEDFDRQLRALTALDRRADARAAALTRALRHPEDPAAGRLASELWAGVPALGLEVVTWTGDSGLHLEPFHGSSSIIFKWRDENIIFASFKPSQSIRRQYYRSEVAADRLAHILGLGIVVPESREVQVSWDDFHSLSGIEPGDETFHQTNARLQWLGEGGDRYLRGVSKTWIRGLRRFPIEYADVWTPWLDGSRDAEWLRETRVSDAVEGFRERPRDHYAEVAREAHGMTTLQLAHQLSDLHVFDVLVNNYDRYQPEGLQLGMNCHIVAGSLVSLDNGAGFPTRDDHDWRRVRNKVESITRFSRSTYQMLSALDPAALRPALFLPDPHADQEDDRFEYFVERWEWMLARINQLIEERGEAEVLMFP